MQSSQIRRYIGDYYEFWTELNNLYAVWAKRWGLTFYGLLVLDVIGECEGVDSCGDGARRGCTQKHICERLYLSKQTVNTILDALERKGLLTRAVMEGDRRNKAVRFTEEGAEWAGQVLTELRRAEENALLQMPPERREAMAENNRLFCRCLERELGGGAGREPSC